MSAEAQVGEEDRERQLEEIQALASIFGGEDEFTTSSSQLRSFVETGDHDFVDRSLAALSFELRVAVESVTGDGGDGSDVAPAGLCLSCTIPPGYPSRTAASMTGSIEHMLAKRADLTELNAMLARELQSRVGDECIFEVADTAREWVAARIADLESASSTASEKATNQVEGDWGRGDSLTRSFFYCHHIRTKQARVYEWSEELRLSGRVKIGWPGWIYVEGSDRAMLVFTKRVKAEHWRRIAPRWDEAVPVPQPSTESVDAARLFKDGMREVEAEQFFDDFRSRGREDILAAGTGVV